MCDQPEPTDEEQEETPERRREEDAMRGAGHEDPGAQRPVRTSGPGEGAQGPENPTPEDVGVPAPPEPSDHPSDGA